MECGDGSVVSNDGDTIGWLGSPNSASDCSSPFYDHLSGVSDFSGTTLENWGPPASPDEIVHERTFVSVGTQTVDMFYRTKLNVHNLSCKREHSPEY